ncbi:ExeM/NucH family extracellular endonuclease [Lysobacter sp. TLK-CK17T]|uniref:ExeM/NucH family extracellular endonuclease n=1 Tax=Marilutibacter chinensis TaxID=2912247 RepID=A0ABS9HS02_9GAMM|nr:ExeM/NucH family extracellular endonuclease [Lysobacter chinensis]
MTLPAAARRPFPARSRRLAAVAAGLALALAAGCDGAVSLAPGTGTNSAARASATLAIGAVQGDRGRSPYVGEQVRVEGVVTADFTADDGLGGVYLQDAGDGNPATSDAIFVPVAHDAPFRDLLRRGARVGVQGRVAELDGGGQVRLTALLADTVEQLGLGEVAVTELRTPPVDWERFEGMRVRIVAPLTVGSLGDLERYGEMLVSFDGRLWQPAERAAPDSDAARAIAADNARRRLVLDDGRAGDNRPLAGSIWPDGAAQLRSGSTIEAAEGILDHRHGRYRLQLDVPPTLVAQPRPPAPTVPGDLRVAAFNLENLFNGDGRGGGFPTPRGARSPAQLQAQLDKLVATIRALDPDIAALMELENDGYGPDSSVATLVDALNDGGTGDWRFVEGCDRNCRREGRGPGDDAIRVGLIYRAGRVRPQGRPAMLEGGPFGPRSRVPLAQAFAPQAGGPPLVVVANHFKSKGCNEAEGDDRDNGAGCWNALRAESARRLSEWLATDPTRSGSDLAMIVGDLNAYAQEEPLRVLARAGWRDAFALAGSSGAGNEAPYSYVYEGEAGRLDHALLSPALAGRLRGAVEWHSNADEPRSASYWSRGRTDGPWRSSDHDPLLLGFDWEPVEHPGAVAEAAAD